MVGLIFVIDRNDHKLGKYQKIVCLGKLAFLNISATEPQAG